MDKIYKKEIAIKNLTKKFTSNTIIENFNMNILKHEKITIFAPSGSGKTTLLNLIIGIDKEYEGSIKLYTNNHAVIYQEPLLFPYKTIKENIFYFLKLRKKFNINKFKKIEDIINIKEIEIHSVFPLHIKNNQKNKHKNTKLTHNYIIKCDCKKIYYDYKNWLAVTGLERYEDYYPYQISGGMKQKVAIIRAFLINPELVLMDEPFKSIDFESKAKIIKFINDYYKDTTILFTTHNIDEIPEITNKVLFFKNKPLKNPQIIKITPEIKSCNTLLSILKELY